MKYLLSRTGCLTLTVLCIGLASCRPTTELRNTTGETTTESSTEIATESGMSQQEKDAVAGLQWLNSADPQQAAANELRQAAALSRKPTLMAFAGRGLNYPGLSKEQLAAIRDKVNHKVADGSGDVIYGDVHREMRMKLRAYAIAYNQAIAAAVQ